MVSTRRQSARQGSPHDGENRPRRHRRQHITRLRITRLRFTIPPPVTGRDEEARGEAQEQPILIPNDAESDSDQGTTEPTRPTVDLHEDREAPSATEAALRLTADFARRATDAERSEGEAGDSPQDPGDTEREEGSVGEPLDASNLSGQDTNDPNDTERVEDQVDTASGVALNATGRGEGPVDRNPRARPAPQDTETEPRATNREREDRVRDSDEPTAGTASTEEAHLRENTEATEDPELRDSEHEESQAPAPARGVPMMGSHQPQTGVIVVPTGRMTRSVYNAKFQAHKDALDQACARQRHLEEIDAELASVLEKENEEALGGALSGSHDGDESDYEPTQEHEPSGESSGSAEPSDSEDDQPLAVSRKKARPGSSDMRKRRDAPTAKPARVKRRRVSAADDIVASSGSKGKAKLKRLATNDDSGDGDDADDDGGVSRHSTAKRTRSEHSALKGKGKLKRTRAPEDDPDVSLTGTRKQSRTAARYALFKRRTSTNVVTRNQTIAKLADKIPESFVKYAQTLVCTHGLPRQKSKKEKDAQRRKKAKKNGDPGSSKNESKGVRRRYHRYIGCTAVVNVMNWVVFSRHFLQAGRQLKTL